MAVGGWSGELDPDGPFALGMLLLASTGIVTGALVAAAFLLPRTVGALISGRALLALELTVVGSVLALIAVLPDGEGTGPGVERGPRTGDGDGSSQPLDDGRQAAGNRRERDGQLARIRAEVDGAVGYPGVFIAAVVVVAFLVVPTQTREVVGVLEATVFGTGRELLLGAVVTFVAGAAVLAVGPWGRIKLGGEAATPEFSDLSYVMMLFSAGIAAGIVFWGPAEAVFHYGTVPPFLEASRGTESGVVGALQTTLFHWGVSAWSTYLAVGLPIAYAAYNLDAPLRVSSVLVPFMGTDAVDTVPGRILDVLAVVATLGGLATTLGFLSAQFLTGIEYRWGVDPGVAGEVLLVAGLAVIVTVSVLAGLGRGMRRLSSVNTVLFGSLLVGLVVVGPTAFIFDTGVAAVGGYATDFVGMSLYAGGGDWLAAWTIFYWAWWLSWAPFVGLFLARISRGRRVRTVVLAAVGATSLATLTWFVVVGATTLSLQESGAVDFLAVIDSAGVAVAGYPLFDALALGDLLLVPFLLLIITFFITSADAATHSLALLTSRADRPSATLQVLLVVLSGVIATVLIVFGGRGVVRSVAVVTGGPFAVVGLIALAGLAVAIRDHEGPAE
jgi:glycine betaine transporter